MLPALALALPALLALQQLGAAASEGSTAGSATCSTVDKIILGFGNNLGPQLTANTTGDCCDFCRANPKCKSWTYHPKGAAKTICYLHKTVGPSSKQDPSVISGVPHGVVPKHPVGPPPPPHPRTCGPEFLGCFKEVVPAPGVPPIRALSHLAFIEGTVDLPGCTASCAKAGYPNVSAHAICRCLRCTGLV